MPTVQSFKTDVRPTRGFVRLRPGVDRWTLEAFVPGVTATAYDYRDDIQRQESADHLQDEFFNNPAGNRLLVAAGAAIIGAVLGSALGPGGAAAGAAAGAVIGYAKADEILDNLEDGDGTASLPDSDDDHDPAGHGAT